MLVCMCPFKSSNNKVLRMYRPYNNMSLYYIIMFAFGLVKTQYSLQTFAFETLSTGTHKDALTHPIKFLVETKHITTDCVDASVNFSVGRRSCHLSYEVCFVLTFAITTFSDRFPC